MISLDNARNDVFQHSGQYDDIQVENLSRLGWAIDHKFVHDIYINKSKPFLQNMYLKKKWINARQYSLRMQPWSKKKPAKQAIFILYFL